MPQKQILFLMKLLNLVCFKSGMGRTFKPKNFVWAIVALHLTLNKLFHLPDTNNGFIDC